MNGIELVDSAQHRSMGWYLCDKCRKPYHLKSHADSCCMPAPCMYCRKPTEKIAQQGGYEYWHSACFSAKQAVKDAEAIDKAEKLETWAGWVSYGSGPNDGYFESIDAFAEYLEDNCDEDSSWPEWVFIARGHAEVMLDIGNILENVCDDGYDDMADDLKGTKELEAAIEIFNKANAGVLVYREDRTKVVRVPPPRPE